MRVDTREWFRRLVESAGESRDNVGKPADHDEPYTFGNPRACLTTMIQARLTIMRGIVLDVSHAPLSIRSQLRYGGDDDYAYITPSGIVVPLPPPQEQYWSDDT